MNLSATNSQRTRSVRRTLLLFALLLAVTTAAVSWLVPLVTPSLPGPVQALFGAVGVTVVAVPFLWYSIFRRGASTEVPERPCAEQIVRSAKEGILTINKHGLVLALNPAAEELFGYRSAEVRNQPITLLVADPPSQESQKLLHDSLPVGTVLGLAAGAREVVGKRKNGETIPLELTVSSAAYDDDPVSVVFARNISKRKQAQRYLTAHYAATCILAEACSLAEALPRLLQAICEALRCEAGVFWRLDPDAGVLHSSEVYQAPFAALPPWPNTEPLTCQREQGLAGRVWSTGKPFWVEDLLRTHDCPCLALAVPLQLHGAFAFPILMGQDVCGVMTFFSCRPLRKEEQLLDIMAELGKQIGQFMSRKHNEEALRETTQTLQALVQAAPVAINIIDLDGKVQLWNPAAERILGWLPAESLGQPLPWLQGEGQDDARGILSTVLQGRTFHGLSFSCQRKDGSAVEVSLSAAPLRDTGGALLGAVVMLMDLTEQKQLEDRLRQAQKMEAVGQLAGGVAHDFNNLLTVITGYSAILFDYLPPGDQALEFLEQIKQAGERAAALTRQLLAFGRKQTLQVQVLDPNVLVRNIERMLRRLISEDIEIVVAQDSFLGQVKADPVQVEQVLLNLAVNARDAMSQGGTLTLTTANVELDAAWAQRHPEVLPGPYVLLTVRDTGCGMSAETKARIFEPFFTTKEVGKGTGLGLATVYGIVKQSGGHIEVDSQLGHGSTFRVYLPRLKQANADCSEVESAAHLPRGKETVLLVEDEDSVRHLMNHSLRMSGYTVLEAKSGWEALKLCEKHKGDIALLVTDVIMPYMNGRQLAERATALQQDLSVLYISGYTDSVLDNHGILAPETAFLQKPVTPRALAAKVREVLDKGAPSRRHLACCGTRAGEEEF